MKHHLENRATIFKLVPHYAINHKTSLVARRKEDEEAQQYQKYMLQAK